MRLSIVGIVALLLGCALAHRVVSNEADAKSMYAEFKRKYNKAITNKDDDLRFTIFRKNLERIDQMQKNEQGTTQYGVTKFADLTDCDWRAKGAVGPVLDQGSCHASWAFSTVGNIEGQYYIQQKKFVSFSKQQLIDCDRNAYGCHGGYPPLAYEELIEMGGLMSEDDYPYEALDGMCRMNKRLFNTSVNSSVILPQNEEYLASYLNANGPLSAAVNVGTLQFYTGGVVGTGSCSPDVLNLDVLLVGFHLGDNQTHWIVKNSWGEDWGEEGYFRVHYGDGLCGINRAVSSAILKV